MNNMFRKRTGSAKGGGDRGRFSCRGQLDLMDAQKAVAASGAATALLAPAVTQLPKNPLGITVKLSLLLL